MIPEVRIAEIVGAIAEDALDAAGEGLRIRHDIGTADLVAQRVEHMSRLRGS